MESGADYGGERGIRTPEGLLTLTRFPGVRLKPLIHLSAAHAGASDTPEKGRNDKPPSLSRQISASCQCLSGARMPATGKRTTDGKTATAESPACRYAQAR